MKACAQCSKEFEPDRVTARFCSSGCKTTWTNHNRKLLTHKCAGCGLDFKSKSKHVKYCSLSCGTKYSKPERRITCVSCNTPFIFKGRGRCDRCEVCRAKYLSKYQMQWRAQRDPAIKIGVGSGGNQWGENNPSWKPIAEHKSTRYRAHYRARCFKHWPKVCAVDAAHTSRIEVHHIDGNPDNFRACNLIPFCNKCHWKIHRKRWKTEKEFVDATLVLLSEVSRNKIAELSGEAEKPIRTEGRVSRARSGAEHRGCGNNNTPKRLRH